MIRTFPTLVFNYRFQIGLYMFLVTLLWGGFHACGDQISLRDGRVISGQLYRQGGAYLIQPENGASFTVPLNAVVAIAMGPAPDSPAAARQNWEMLNGQINKLSDIQEIMTRVKAYIKKYPHSPSLTDATRTLAQYKKILADGWVKFGDQWMPAAQRGIMLAGLKKKTQVALTSLQAGRWLQAARQAQEVLKTAPHFADALIVAGVAQYQMGKLPQAAHDFHLVVRQHPENPMGWNNLAIVVDHQRLAPQALRDYATALPLAAGNRILLDNIAAALHGYKQSRRSALYKNLMRSFTHADIQMQKLMALRGLYRYGNTWVTKSEITRLRKRIQEYHIAKAALQTQYDAATQELNSTDQQLKQVAVQISNLTNQIVSLQVQQQIYATQTGVYDLNTQLLINNYSTSLNQQQALQAQLLGQKNTIIAAMQHMRRIAQKMKANPVVARYTGNQQMLLPTDLLSSVPKPQPAPAPATSGFVPIWGGGAVVQWNIPLLPRPIATTALVQSDYPLLPTYDASGLYLIGPYCPYNIFSSYPRWRCRGNGDRQGAFGRGWMNTTSYFNGVGMRIGVMAHISSH